MRHVAHLAQALLLERRVADRQHLVHQQDLRLQVRGDGEGQPHVHAARVALDRRVEELLDLGEGDDLVELARDLGAAACPGSRRSGRCSRARSAPGGSRCRPRAASRRGRGSRRAPVGRLGDPREDLQQRALAGAVAADDAERPRRGCTSKETSLQRPERLGRRGSPPARRAAARRETGAAPRRPATSRSVVVAARRLPDAVVLAEARRPGWRRRSSAQTTSAKRPFHAPEVEQPADEQQQRRRRRDDASMRARGGPVCRAAPSGSPRPRRPSG